MKLLLKCFLNMLVLGALSYSMIAMELGLPGSKEDCQKFDLVELAHNPFKKSESVLLRTVESLQENIEKKTYASPIGTISPQEVSNYDISPAALLEFYKTKLSIPLDEQDHKAWEIKQVTDLKNDNPELFNKFCAGVVTKAYQELHPEVKNNVSKIKKSTAPVSSEDAQKLIQNGEDFMKWFYEQSVAETQAQKDAAADHRRKLLASMTINCLSIGTAIITPIVLKMYGCAPDQ